MKFLDIDSDDPMWHGIDNIKPIKGKLPNFRREREKRKEKRKDKRMRERRKRDL